MSREVKVALAVVLLWQVLVTMVSYKPGILPAAMIGFLLGCVFCILASMVTTRVRGPRDFVEVGSE